MSLSRRAKKRDANERAIIEELKAIGAEVYQLDRPVDLVIGYRGETYLAEVKSTTGRLTMEQELFIKRWKGSPVLVLRGVKDVWEAFPI